MKKLFIPLLAMGMVVFTDVTFAAFGGSRGSSGVSRSYSRPATPTYSKPATTYKAPATTTRSAPSYSSSTSSYSNSYTAPKRTTSSDYRSSYNSHSGYSNSNYRYNDQPRQSSVGRDIAVGAAAVGGGILAAQAITALVSSPNHPGMYTHPQYPGQYFNQAGVPMPAPVQQAAPQPVQTEQYAPPAPPQQYLQPQSQYQQPVVVVQQAPKAESGLSFFGFLWGALWFIIKLAFFLGVVGALGYGIYKLIQLGRRKEVRDQVQTAIQGKLNPVPAGPSDFDDLDGKAMDIFYAFQKNSNDEAWVAANTKYLPVDECLSAPSKVLFYQHATQDAVIEQGKVRGTVKYEATLNDGTGEVSINQYWNFEKDNGVWKLIGIEQVD